MPSFSFLKYVAEVGYSEPDSIRLSQSSKLGGTYSQVGYDQLLNDGAELSASSNDVGQNYRITAHSLVDFTTIGAANNSVGTEFLATGTVTLTAADKLLPLGLTDDPDDSLNSIVTEATADTAKYTRFAFVTASGVIGDTALLEPKISTPDSFQIFAYGVDAGLSNVSGIELDCSPVGGIATSGDNSVVQSVRVETDANGRASIDTVPADAGIFYINFGGERKKIDTTGRGATSVNWKDI